MSTESRNFTIHASETGKIGGVYTGKLPSSAAKKAARALFAEYNGPKRKLVFQLREKGTKIVSHYEATFTKLAKPEVIVRGGKTIEITRKLKVKYMGRNTEDCKPTANLSVRRSRSPSPSRA